MFTNDPVENVMWLWPWYLFNPHEQSFENHIQDHLHNIFLLNMNNHLRTVQDHLHNILISSHWAIVEQQSF